MTMKHKNNKVQKTFFTPWKSKKKKKYIRKVIRVKIHKFLHLDVCNISKREKRRKIYVKRIVENLFLLKIAVKNVEKKEREKKAGDPIEVVCENTEKKTVETVQVGKYRHIL